MNAFVKFHMSLWVCLNDHSFHDIEDLPNYYGLNKLVANYDKAYDVLAGNIRSKWLFDGLLYR